jgi:hypothetical protein
MYQKVLVPSLRSLRALLIGHEITPKQSVGCKEEAVLLQQIEKDQYSCRYYTLFGLTVFILDYSFVSVLLSLLHQTKLSHHAYLVIK